MKIAFVSCTKSKANRPCSAKEMYQKSTMFKKAVQFIEQQDYDEGMWYVLSAKYGLIKQQDEIEPYDLTLNNMKVLERKKWTELVLNQIEDLQIDMTHVDFYVGVKYREFIIPALEEKGIVCNIPLQGLGFFKQLSYYKTHTK